MYIDPKGFGLADNFLDRPDYEPSTFGIVSDWEGPISGHSYQLAYQNLLSWLSGGPYVVRPLSGTYQTNEVGPVGGGGVKRLIPRAIIVNPQDVSINQD